MASFIASYIGRQIAYFVKDFNKDNFNLALLKGEAELTEAQLNEEVINEALGMPNLICTSASAKDVRVAIPWTRIRSQPVSVSIGALELHLAEPSVLAELPPPPSSSSSSKSYSLSDKIIDLVKLDVGEITITLSSIGPTKPTSGKPPSSDSMAHYSSSSPHILACTLSNVTVNTTDAKWHPVNMAGMHKPNSKQPEMFIYREARVGALSVVLVDPAVARSTGTNLTDAAHSTKRRPAMLLAPVPAVIHVTERRRRKGVVPLGMKVELILDHLFLSLTPALWKSAYESVLGLQSAMARPPVNNPASPASGFGGDGKKGSRRFRRLFGGRSQTRAAAKADVDNLPPSAADVAASADAAFAEAAKAPDGDMDDDDEKHVPDVLPKSDKHTLQERPPIMGFVTAVSIKSLDVDFLADPASLVALTRRTEAEPNVPALSKPVVWAKLHGEKVLIELHSDVEGYEDAEKRNTVESKIVAEFDNFSIKNTTPDDSLDPRFTDFISKPSFSSPFDKSGSNRSARSSRRVLSIVMSTVFPKVFPAAPPSLKTAKYSLPKSGFPTYTTEFQVGSSTGLQVIYDVPFFDRLLEFLFATLPEQRDAGVSLTPYPPAPFNTEYLLRGALPKVIVVIPPTPSRVPGTPNWMQTSLLRVHLNNLRFADGPSKGVSFVHNVASKANITLSAPVPGSSHSAAAKCAEHTPGAMALKYPETGKPPPGAPVAPYSFVGAFQASHIAVEYLPRASGTPQLVLAPVAGASGHVALVSQRLAEPNSWYSMAVDLKLSGATAKAPAVINLSHEAYLFLTHMPVERLGDPSAELAANSWMIISAGIPAASVFVADPALASPVIVTPSDMVVIMEATQLSSLIHVQATDFSASIGPSKSTPDVFQTLLASRAAKEKKKTKKAPVLTLDYASSYGRSSPELASLRSRPDVAALGKRASATADVSLTGLDISLLMKHLAALGPFLADYPVEEPPPVYDLTWSVTIDKSKLVLLDAPSNPEAVAGEFTSLAASGGGFTRSKERVLVKARGLTFYSYKWKNTSITAATAGDAIIASPCDLSTTINLSKVGDELWKPELRFDLSGLNLSVSSHQVDLLQKIMDTQGAILSGATTHDSDPPPPREASPTKKGSSKHGSKRGGSGRRGPRSATDPAVKVPSSIPGSQGAKAAAASAASGSKTAHSKSSKGHATFATPPSTIGRSRKSRGSFHFATFHLAPLTSPNQSLIGSRPNSRAHSRNNSRSGEVAALVAYQVAAREGELNARVKDLEMASVESKIALASQRKETESLQKLISTLRAELADMSAEKNDLAKQLESAHLMMTASHLAPYVESKPSGSSKGSRRGGSKRSGSARKTRGGGSASFADQARYAPDKAGWLQKRGDHMKKWNRRWFALKGDNLYYFLEPSDKSARGVLPLGSATIEAVDTSKYKMAFCFVVKSSKLTFILAASSDSELKDWMTAINKNKSK